jgi:hypothetical protein
VFSAILNLRKRAPCRCDYLVFRSGMAGPGSNLNGRRGFWGPVDFQSRLARPVTACPSMGNKSDLLERIPADHRRLAATLEVTCLTRPAVIE